MKIVITGALGHIGSLLIRELPNNFNDLEIIMIDDLSTQRYGSLFNLSPTIRYRFIESNVQTLNLSQLLAQVDAVIHLAAMTDAASTVDKPDIVYQNNFNSTRIIGEACLNANVPLIFPSSTSVYSSSSTFVDETCTEIKPQNPYAACKVKEEDYLNQLFQNGLKGIICRLGTIYGVSPGMRFHTAVNKFCWQAVMNQPITVWETALHQKRPYLALEDCCNAISWIVQKRLYDGEVYNIVSNNLTVSNVLDEIKKHIPNFSIQLVQHKIMNQLSYEVSADKISATGYVFKNRLSQGIKDTIDLLKNSNK